MEHDAHLGLHDTFLSDQRILPISLEQYLQIGNVGSESKGATLTGRHCKAAGIVVGPLMPTPQGALSALELERPKLNEHVDIILDAQVHETSKKVGIFFPHRETMYYWTGTGYALNFNEPSPRKIREKET